MYRILIVEDDPGIAGEIERLAQTWGLRARTVRDFSDVMAEFAAWQPHLVLLDIGLPCFDGYHWCGEIRKVSKAPILFLSCAGDNLNIVMAMHLGADDFIVKPFDAQVLVAKMQALLRRSYDYDLAAASVLYAHRGALLDADTDSLRFDGKTVALTKNESRILRCLLENKGKTVSREQLMERLWKTEQFIDENTLTVNVNRLRKKLDAVGLPDFITTVFGVGYQIK